MRSIYNEGDHSHRYILIKALLNSYTIVRNREVLASAYQTIMNYPKTSRLQSACKTLDPWILCRLPLPPSATRSPGRIGEIKYVAKVPTFAIFPCHHWKAAQVAEGDQYNSSSRGRAHLDCVSVRCTRFPEDGIFHDHNLLVFQ